MTTLGFNFTRETTIMNTIQIESGIPMPTIQGRPNMYPWKDMAVGDSFKPENTPIRTMYTMACRAGKLYGKKFAVRSTENGYRVWRTK